MCWFFIQPMTFNNYEPLFESIINIGLVILQRVNEMDQEFDYDNYEYGAEGGEEYPEGENYQYNQEEPYGEEEAYGGQNDHQIQQSGQYQQMPYDILPLQKIFEEINAILDEVKTVVYMDRGWCLLLLKEFKFDKDYLREEYYNKMEVYQKQVGLRSDLKTLEQCTQVKDMCMVCCSQDSILVENICSHAFCLECWLGGLRSSISQGNPFMRCMDQSCGAPLLMERVEAIMSLANQQSLRKKFHKKLCEELISQNRNYQFCTGADCGNCIRINQMQIGTVRCACGKIFCFKCMSDDHYPCKCEQKLSWMKQVMAEEADAKWISANAKICPSCKKAVERAMGCNFMACTCGKNFCYMCSQPWQPDHKDHFKCHIYKKRPDEVVTRQKEVMQKMNHCTQRYVFNQAVANNYKQIDVFVKRKYLFKVLGIELTDSQFMETAYKFAIQCCEKLKWIYAFTFFVDMGHRKDAFEFSLGEYEKYKQNLLKLLAVDLKQFMGEIQKAVIEKRLNQGVVWDLQDRFKGLKKTIVNLYTCTKNYKDKFVEELQRTTEQLDHEKEMKEMRDYAPEKKKKSDTKKDTKKEGLFGNLNPMSWGKTRSKGK